MTLDEFDEKLKELLREAGISGIAISRIDAHFSDTHVYGENEYILDEVNVEYRSR